MFWRPPRPQKLLNYENGRKKSIYVKKTSLANFGSPAHLAWTPDKVWKYRNWARNMPKFIKNTKSWSKFTFGVNFDQLTFCGTTVWRKCIFLCLFIIFFIIVDVLNGPSTYKTVLKWYRGVEEYYSYNFVKSLRLVLDCWIPSTVRCPGHHCPRYIHQFRLVRRKVPKCGYQGLPNPYVKPFGARLLIKCTSEPGPRSEVAFWA